MTKKVYVIIILFFLNINLYSQKIYNFVSIENLIEQEIGKIIIPVIYEKLNMKITITSLPGARAQKEVSIGNKDGEIMRIWSYGLENKNVIRVPTPYYNLETMAFIKRNSNIKIETVEDLRKYRLVKVRGVKHTNNLTKGMPFVHNLSSTETMMAFLERDRADVVLTNTLDGQLILKKLNNSNITHLLEPLKILPLYHYIHKKYEYLVPKVNEIINQMKVNGELDILIKKAEEEIRNRY